MSDLNTPSPQLSSRLTRQIKRHLGIQDGVDGVSCVLLKIRNGDALSEDEAKFISGFSDFLSSVDSSYSESDDKNRMAVRNLEISSEELNLVNRNLEELNQKINAMLDGLGQGLLFFNKDGECSSVFSKACLDIFGVPPTGQYFKDILNLKPDQIGDLEMWLSIVFDETTPIDFNDLKTLAPQSYINDKNQYIEIDYRPIYLSGPQVEGILCIATDKTFEISAREELNRKQDEAAQIRMIASNRNEFQRYISCFDEYINFLEEQKTNLSDMATLIMHLHNFKGMSGVFHFTDLVKAIHQMENLVKVKDFQGFISDLPRFLNTVQSQKAAAIDIGTLLFGDNFIASDSIVSIDFEKLNSFRDILKQNNHSSDLSNPLLKVFDTLFLTVKVSDCFKTFQMELDRVSTSQNKPNIHFKVNGNGIIILPKKYNEFFDSLMHLARNIVDHGIDTPENRMAAEKSAHGNVFIESTVSSNNRLILSIADDGKGLSADNIAHKLKKMDKFNPSETQHEIIQHIFDSDFSIKDEASLVSGRGVGMYAVKQAVEDIGGTVVANNIEGDSCGAQFIFDLPFFTP